VIFITLFVIVLSCLYDCHYAGVILLSGVQITVITLIVMCWFSMLIFLSVLAHIVAMLSVTIQIVILLSVIILNVTAPRIKVQFAASSGERAFSCTFSFNRLGRVFF
jgi:hypothetical protein